MQTITSGSHGPSASAVQYGNRDEVDYTAYLQRIVARFNDLVGDGKTPLFTTELTSLKPGTTLFDIYLDTFKTPADRQYHNCNACRHFINHFGGLATIDADGQTRSAIWTLHDIPGPYTDFVICAIAAVENAKVTGVFVTDQAYLGDPSMAADDIWTHFHVQVPATIRHKSKLHTPYQVMAEKKEDFKNMEEALRRYTAPIITRAMAVLESDALYRADKVLAPAAFLERVQLTRIATHDRRIRANKLWLDIATAPAGFCHPRSSMVGTLLDDLADGMDFDAVKRRFASKMSPLLYQRPQAAPTAGNLASAEKIVEKLGIARSLERRYARVEEMQAMWRPSFSPKSTAPHGVFGHLRKQSEGDAPYVVTTNEHITFARFRDNILPRAERVEAYVSASHGQNFVGISTAVHADAPPILQWDSEEQRNPVCWFVMHNGSPPSAWSLKPESWIDVTAVSLNPSMWGNRPTNHTQGAVLSLAGAVSTLKIGNALFPECMKAELHAIRATIEAYSKTATLADAEQGTANGLMINEKNASPVRVRVTSKNVVTTYTIDRWN